MSREGYKMTELGEIPQEWDIKNIGDVAKLQGGFAFKSDDYVEDGINLIKITNVQRNKLTWNERTCLPQDFLNQYSEYSLKENDIVMAMTRPVISSGIKVSRVRNEDLPALLNQRVGRFLIAKEMDIRYLYYYTYSDYFINKVKELSTATNQPNISSKLVESIKVIVPPLHEQQKIADILSTIDQQIEQNDALIEKTKELKKGLMQRLLTKGIGHTEFKDTEIGRIPKEWEVKELGQVTDVRDGTHDSPKYVDAGIPLVTSKNIKDYEIDFTEVKYISEADHKKIQQRSKVDDGDIIFAMIGTIGNPVIVNKQFEFSVKNVALIKFTGASVKNTYVLHLLKSSIIEKQFEQKSAGGVQKFVSLGLIRGLKIPVPPILEQRKISDILDSIDNQIKGIFKKRDALLILKKSLMQQLLTGRIRVE